MCSADSFTCRCYMLGSMRSISDCCCHLRGLYCRCLDALVCDAPNFCVSGKEGQRYFGGNASFVSQVYYKHVIDKDSRKELEQIDLVQWQRAEWVAYWEINGDLAKLCGHDSCTWERAVQQVADVGILWKHCPAAKNNIGVIFERTLKIFDIPNWAGLPNCIDYYCTRNSILPAPSTTVFVGNEIAGCATFSYEDKDGFYVVARVDDQRVAKFKEILSRTKAYCR